ncbi:DEAD/DEAH box helicase [Bremerella sp.]|uniref:DEAD/DEAH box helicase n=1 Tax=Bremerella sp. TaxID=2795602 RepID=UPI00391C8E21
MSVFSKFSPRLQEAIVSRLGFTSLRPVQELAGEAILAGKNAVVLAPTAGGKTEASIFPTLSGLVDKPVTHGVGAIYIAPIKALLNNQAHRLDEYTEMVGLRRFVWHGDTPSNERQKFLKDPAELLMTTPESLEVMLVSQRVPAEQLFSDLRYIIIDEVHAIAGSDRGAHLMSVMERIARCSTHDLQRVGLSATVGNPEAILAWLHGTSERDGIVVDPPKKPARRQLQILHRPGLVSIAEEASKKARGAKSLFFCQSRSTSEAVAEQMRRQGTEVFVHHSAVSKEERQFAEEQFHQGSDACIVCTSTLELGIDVGDLDYVLQAEAPDTVSAFMQRMGRTGRRGDTPANTTFYCETSEGVLQAIAIIELAKSGWVESIEVNDRCWPVLIHQLLAMSLAANGIRPEEAWEHLSLLPDFSGIEREEFDRLIAWMIQDGSLVLSSGLLSLGPKAERRFGRRNFMELFAVFSTPKTYTVTSLTGAPVGSLMQDFVDRLVESVSSFLLGGRAWAVHQINHDDRKITVVPAPVGKQPSWGGFLPQFLGFDLCQQILKVLTSREDYPYLERDARGVILEERQKLGFLDPRCGGIDGDTHELRWWTFAGGRINSTLRYALTFIEPNWTFIPDNYAVRIRGSSPTSAWLSDSMNRLGDSEFWESPAFIDFIRESLPSYRLSKFQPLMPPWVEQEVLGKHLLEFVGSKRLLNSSLGIS